MVSVSVAAIGLHSRPLAESRGQRAEWRGATVKTVGFGEASLSLTGLRFQSCGVVSVCNGYIVIQGSVRVCCVHSGEVKEYFFLFLSFFHWL